ncbi:MAG: GAF domain-containing protein [Candidatus Eisenbacteria bacterium]|nr:GAF domain-containing protein [Candidatus Eisenbacteria bacterium]
MRREPEPAEREPSSEKEAASPPDQAAARDLLQNLGRSLSAVERSLLAERETRTLEETEKLNRRLNMYERLVLCVRSLSSILDLETLIGAILQEVVGLCRVDRGFLLRPDPHGRLRVERGFDASLGHLDAAFESEVSRSLATTSFRDGRSLWVTDALQREEFRTQESIQALNLSVIVCVPVRTTHGPIGVLYLDSRRPETLPAQEDLDVLEAFAAQAAVALENARLHREILDARAGLERENRGLRQSLPGSRGASEILGRSRAIEELRQRIGLVQEVLSPVLILGETGTGKELVATAIHAGSPRGSGPLLRIHCGAVPADLLESEMFGHKRGSFTGAVQDKQGLFEAASGGTLLLDEIGEMPVKLQVKLLRALESQEIRRVGETHERKVDVRVLSATNRDLEQAIRDGEFREDLYYRLMVVTLRVPPLRERRDDIPLLAEHFLRKTLTALDRPYGGFTPGAMRFLLEQSWPGNVRELKNLIEGSCVFLRRGEPLDVSDLQLAGRGKGASEASAGYLVADGGLRERREDVERRLLLGALNNCGWNVSSASRTLGISRQHLHNRIRHHRLKRPSA